MSDYDLIERFDAVLPRLSLYEPRCVPLAGHREYHDYQELAGNRRADLGVYGAAAAATGAMTWLFWFPWMPIWLLASMAATAGVSGVAAARRFLQLAFNQRLEQALPSGTDAATAQLEDGSWKLIHAWNHDAFVWNRCVDDLRLEVAGWQLMKNVLAARGVEWTEEGSRSQAESLIAAAQGLAFERTALVARKEAIDRGLHRLEARLRQLKASEYEPPLALPPPNPDDPADDG